MGEKLRNGLSQVFLEEKLERVKKALQQLKKDQKIKWFLGPFRMGVTFYIIYVEGKYFARPLRIAKSEEENKSSNRIWVSPFESEGSLRRKILETIKRL